MQLTNIARDVGEDARNGSIYLPLDWLEEAGVDADGFIGNRRPRPAFAPHPAPADEADTLYARSLSGIAMLPAACRPSIHAARVLYAEIGREVERSGCDSVSRAPSSPPPASSHCWAGRWPPACTRTAHRPSAPAASAVPDRCGGTRRHAEASAAHHGRTRPVAHGTLHAAGKAAAMSPNALIFSEMLLVIGAGAGLLLLGTLETQARQEEVSGRQASIAFMRLPVAG